MHMPMQRRAIESVEREFFAARPIKPDLGVLGRKWALLILADIGLRRVDRFSGLLRSNPNLNSRILSRRLRELVEAGMIRKGGKKRATGAGGRGKNRKRGDNFPPPICLKTVCAP